MGEGEPMSYEERAAVALETGFPRHYAFISGGAATVRGGRGDFEVIAVSMMCVGKFPSQVYGIADHGLMTECPDCHQPFVWTDRTQAWTAT